MTNRKAADTPDEAPWVLPSPPFMPWNGSAMETFGRFNEAVAKASLEWQKEVGRFVAARVGKDIEAQRTLTKCRDWAEIVKVQQAWATAAAQAYADETGRMTDIALQCARSVMTPKGS